MSGVQTSETQTHSSASSQPAAYHCKRDADRLVTKLKEGGVWLVGSWKRNDHTLSLILLMMSAPSATIVILP